MREETICSSAIAVGWRSKLRGVEALLEGELEEGRNRNDFRTSGQRVARVDGLNRPPGDCKILQVEPSFPPLRSPKSPDDDLQPHHHLGISKRGASPSHRSTHSANHIASGISVIAAPSSVLSAGVDRCSIQFARHVSERSRHGSAFLYQLVHRKGICLQLLGEPLPLMEARL